jgi:flotillin
MMIDRDVYTKLGETNASAIRGLEPKINYWVTGEGSGVGAGNPIGQIFKNLPPLLDGVYSQTGIKPPAWLANTDELSKLMTKQ